MSISNVAINTFNSSGSQSVCRANKYAEDTLIESDFLTKCTTKYINGTGQTVVQGSMKAFPVGLPGQASNHDTFAMPDDIDAISNVILTARMGFDIPTGSDAGANMASFANSTAIYFSNTFLLTLINKVEIRLGGLVVDTLTSDSIFARNVTETDNSCSMSGSTIDGQEYPNIYTNINRPVYEGTGTAAIKDNVIEWSVSIPFTGRSSKMSGAFLQAGSTTNSLTMKVHYNKFDPEMFLAAVNVPNTLHEHEGLHGAGGLWPIFGIQKLTSNATMIPENWKFSTSATVTTHMITETEKNFIRNNVVNRVLKTSETLEYPTPRDLVRADFTSPIPDNLFQQIPGAPSGEYKQVSFDISKFECNCSHILLSLRVPGVGDDGSFANTKMTKAWPFSKGNRYSASGLVTAATAAPLAPAGPAGFGPWTSAATKKPLFDGWWSGADGKETAGPLVPENNDGDFMTNNLCPLRHKRYETEPTLISWSPVFSDPAFLNAAGQKGSSYLVGPYNNGQLEYIESTGDRNSDNFMPTVPIVGYTRDWLDSVELVIGGNRTGFIPASALKLTNVDEFGLKSSKDSGGIYMLKLSDEAFSTAGVPLSKCNNIKLNIRIRTSIYGTTGAGTDAYYDGTARRLVMSGFNHSTDWTSLGSPKLVATAVGTTVQTTVGGSISFAA
tara:strand:- start:1250 stop:3256 length:2007 start_codon:yes stop_codon:yes gene_type:complete